MTKRLFDISIALIGLIILSPLFVLVAFLIKLDSEGPVFFRQERIGKNFIPFFIYKFRTMVQDAPLRGGPLTFGKDHRITGIGHILRKTKIDELPQLINVLKGEMSFVGPRPEVKHYIEFFQEEYAQVLRVRPGITDLASLRYRDESAILGQSQNPEEEYIKRILPEKIELAKKYLKRSSFLFDLTIILKTLFKLYI